MVRAAPAVDSQGNLYVGTDDSIGGTAGRLVSLNPVDGGMRTNFPISTGAVQSVAVATSRYGVGSDVGNIVYLNSNGVAGSRIDMYTPDGGVTGQPLVEAVQKTYSALALFRGDAQAVSSVSAAAVINSTGVPGYVGSASPTAAARFSSPSMDYLLPVPGASAPFAPTNAAVFSQDGGVEFVFATGNAPTSPRRLQSVLYSRSGVNWFGPSATSTAFGTGGTVPNSVCGAGVSTFLSLENGTSATATLRGSVVPGAYADLPGAPTAFESASPAVIASRSGAGSDVTVMFGSNLATNASTDWLLSAPANSATATMGGSAQGIATPAGLDGRLLTSPVIGGGGLPHGAGGSADRLYAVQESGALRAFVVSPAVGVSGASAEWAATSSEVFGSPKTVYAHPTLDCTRPYQAGRPGVLYVVATDGTVAAVLVDSSTLSTTAPWPKWQRTAGNAGNPDEALFPRNPGCN